MSRSYRSKYDIIADILEAAMNGAKKTRIMHVANVNYYSFRKYFKMLLEEGLIEEFKNSAGEPLYKTTEEGVKHLKMFTMFSNSIKKRC